SPRSFTLSLHDALPICRWAAFGRMAARRGQDDGRGDPRRLQGVGEEAEPRLRTTRERPSTGTLSPARKTRSSPESSSAAVLTTRSEEHTSELQSRGHLV